MLELILSRENMFHLLKRVEHNKGSHGVDHMSVESLRERIVKNWQMIKHQIIKGTYFPAPVRRVEIPKPNGGKSAVDRPWKRKFSGFSFTMEKKSPRIRIHKESIKRCVGVRGRELVTPSYSIAQKYFPTLFKPF